MAREAKEEKSSGGNFKLEIPYFATVRSQRRRKKSKSLGFENSLVIWTQLGAIIIAGLLAVFNIYTLFNPKPVPDRDPQKVGVKSIEIVRTLTLDLEAQLEKASDLEVLLKEIIKENENLKKINSDLEEENKKLRSAVGDA